MGVKKLKEVWKLNFITGDEKEKQDSLDAILSNFVETTGELSNLFIQELSGDKNVKFSNKNLNEKNGDTNQEDDSS